MKHILITLVVALTILISISVPAVAKKGGCVPATVSCCIGPRVGLEMNEGKQVETSEWLRLICIGWFINCYEAYDKNGCMGCLLEGFIGARVGREYDSRNVRTIEWISLLLPGVSNLIIAVEAYSGKTMTEIEASEHLKK